MFAEIQIDLLADSVKEIVRWVYMDCLNDVLCVQRGRSASEVVESTISCQHREGT